MDRKVALDLPLDERGGHAKFGCTDSYRDQMHKEQTDILLYILRFVRREKSIKDMYFMRIYFYTR